MTKKEKKNAKQLNLKTFETKDFRAIKMKKNSNIQIII